jgi:hypothetical protein
MRTRNSDQVAYHAPLPRALIRVPAEGERALEALLGRW